MSEERSTHSTLPSDERILEYVQAAHKVLNDELPAGHKLWKSWAYDLADNVLALARKRDELEDQLEVEKKAKQKALLDLMTVENDADGLLGLLETCHRARREEHLERCSEIDKLEDQLEVTLGVIRDAADELKLHGILTDHAAGHRLRLIAESNPAKEPK